MQQFLGSCYFELLDSVKKDFDPRKEPNNDSGRTKTVDKVLKIVEKHWFPDFWAVFDLVSEDYVLFQLIQILIQLFSDRVPISPRDRNSFLECKLY